MSNRAIVREPNTDHRTTSLSTPNMVPGALICLAIAAIGIWLGRLIPIIGGPVFAILIGIVIGNVIRPTASTKPGISFCSKKVLQYAIIALGGSLSLGQVWKTGSDSLAVMLVTLSAAFLGAWLIGRKLGISRNLTSLVGVGTAICGGSAIAAIAPIIKADDDDVAFSISTVFLFNVVAVLAFPAIGHLLHMTNHGFGLWAGTAINDTSSVVAAGYSYSQPAGDYAAIAKLARTTMIIPVSFAFALLVGRKTGGERYDFKRIFPWFILGFLALSLLNTLGLLGKVMPGYFGLMGKYLIVVALAGVGLGADFSKMIRTGAKPVILGLLVWILVACTSLGVQLIGKQF